MLIGHQKTKILPFSVAQVDIRIPSLGKVGYSRRAFLLLNSFFHFSFFSLELKHLALDLWKRYPTSELMWYPRYNSTIPYSRWCHIFLNLYFNRSGRYCSNDWSLKFFGTLYHTIPAYLLDFLSAIVGKRRKWVHLK